MQMQKIVYFYNKIYIFIVAAELAIPAGISTEIETNPVTVEAKIILTTI